MEDIIKRAIDLDIDEICFTEHFDYGVKVDVNSNPAKARVDYPKTESDMEVMNHFHHEIHDCKICSFDIVRELRETLALFLYIMGLS